MAEKTTTATASKTAGAAAAKTKAKASGASVKKSDSIIKRVKKLFGGKTKKKPSSSRSSGFSSANSIYTRDDKSLFSAESSQHNSASNLANAGAKTATDAVADGAKAAATAADGKSVASTSSKKSSATRRSYLQVVLLLMDPKTRRFELLQLEFDSEKAKVSDILRQIPLAVTEDIIKNIKYTGVFNANRAVKLEDDKLSEFCKGKDVLVAIPNDMDPEGTIRLARPILGDDKVIDMLESTGVNMAPWKETFSKAASEDAAKADKSKPDEKAEAKSESAPDTKMPAAATAAKKSDATKSDAKSETKEASKSRSITETPPSTSVGGSESSASTASASSSASRSMPTTTKSKSSYTSLFLLILILCIFLFPYVHDYFTAPVAAGKPLAPGSWRSRCGLKKYYTLCDDAFLEVNDDGIVNIYNDQKDLVLTMEGAVCPKKVVADTKDTADATAPAAGTIDNDCVDGLVMTEEGDIIIGGKQVKHAKIRSKEALEDFTPWPFFNVPNINIKTAPRFKMFKPL